MLLMICIIRNRKSIGIYFAYSDLMNSRILLTIAATAVASTQLLALPTPVPDSGGTAGILTLGLLALVALRRKLTK